MTRPLTATGVVLIDAAAEDAAALEASFRSAGDAASGLEGEPSPLRGSPSELEGEPVARVVEEAALLVASASGSQSDAFLVAWLSVAWALGDEASCCGKAVEEEGPLVGGMLGARVLRPAAGSEAAAPAGGRSGVAPAQRQQRWVRYLVAGTRRGISAGAASTW